MSIISALRTYLQTYSGLASGAPVWVNYLDSLPISYAIVPTPGAKIIEQYIDGSTLRQFTFAFQTMLSTADNLQRLEAIGFFEAFAAWLEEQTVAGNLPTLGTGMNAIEISADGWGYLFEEGQSETGIYQINATLIYEQTPVTSGT